MDKNIFLVCRDHERQSMQSVCRSGVGAICLPLLMTLVFLFNVPRIFAQIDPNERKDLYFGVSLPLTKSFGNLDKGHGDPSAVAYFHWNRLKWPTDDMQFRFIFAGLYADTMFTWPEMFGPKTSFNVGAGALAFYDRSVEYRNGEDLDHQQYFGSTVKFYTYVEHEIAKVMDRIPLNVTLGYRVSATDYSREDSTAPTFVIPQDNYTQAAEMTFRLGGISPGIVHREGVDVYLKLEAGWRGNWEQWGPTATPFQTYNDYQKIMVGASALLPIDKFIKSLKNHHIVAQFTGGYGNRLDRISSYKIGGVLPAGRESATLHGFYSGELFASDYFLTNLAYEFPLGDWRELAAHLYADYAAVKRKDIPDHSWKNYEGVGAGLSCKLFNADILLSYGYGINAERLGKRGGHEVALQLFKKF